MFTSSFWLRRNTMLSWRVRSLWHHLQDDRGLRNPLGLAEVDTSGVPLLYPQAMPIPQYSTRTSLSIVNINMDTCQTEHVETHVQHHVAIALSVLNVIWPYVEGHDPSHGAQLYSSVAPEVCMTGSRELFVKSCPQNSVSFAFGRSWLQKGRNGRRMLLDL